jgi:hypothetical protein
MRWRHRVTALFALFLAVALGGAATVSVQPVQPAAAQDGEACARGALRWFGTAYLYLLTQHDPSPLPLSPEVRSTENGAQVAPGEGLWQTAGEVRFSRFLLDTQRCQVHFEAVMQDDGQDALVGSRVRVQGGQVTEIETYVTHEGDYFVFNADGLVQSDSQGPANLKWEDVVPDDQRSTRDELIEIANNYYESFGQTTPLAPIRDDCYRWENGQSMASGDCSVGIGVGSPSMITHRRYPMVDIEAGVVVAYVMFGNALDIHMFKVADGQVRRIDALVTDGGHTSTGWEDQEQQGWAPG